MCKNVNAHSPVESHIDAYMQIGLVKNMAFRFLLLAAAAEASAPGNCRVFCGVDSKGKAWAVWQTKKMPTNFLIAKGGTIIAVADGCDHSGLLAKKLSEKVANLLKTDAVNVQQVVKQQAKKK